MTRDHATELVEALLQAYHDYWVTFDGGRARRDHLEAMKGRVIASLTENASQRGLMPNPAQPKNLDL